MSATLSSRLVRAWVDVYTRGLPADVREARSDEITSDLWSQAEEAHSAGRSGSSLAVEITTRLVLGIPADLLWRVDRGRVADRGVERSSTVGTRVAAVLATLSGAGLLVATVPFVARTLANPDVHPWDLQLGDTGSGLGQAAMIGVCLILGWLSLVLLNRFDSVNGLVGLLGAGGGLMGMAGGYYAILLLPLGSAIVAVSLARFHVIDWWVAVFHVAAAVGFIVPIGAMLGNTPVGNAIVFALLYPVSWIAMGVGLFGGFPSDRRTAPPVG